MSTDLSASNQPEAPLVGQHVDTDSKVSSEPKKLCKYCANEIPITAVLCSNCKYFQSRARNIVVFVISAASLLALVGSFGLFTANQWILFRKSISWKDDVDVIFFQSYSFPDFGIAVTNKGDGPVYVTEILISHGYGNAVYRINTEITPEKTFSANTKVWQSPEYGGFLASADGKIDKYKWDDSSDYADKQACYFRVYFLDTDSDIIRMNTFYNKNYKYKLESESVDALIGFYSPHFGKTFFKKLSVIVAFQKKKEGCGD